MSISLGSQVQERFEVDIKELPEQIDTTTYSKIINLNICIWIFFSRRFSHLVDLRVSHAVLSDAILNVCSAIMIWSSSRLWRVEKLAVWGS